MKIKNNMTKLIIGKLKSQIRLYQEYIEWIQKGKPCPPPHIIKQIAIKKLAKEHGIKILVETGTFYGNMVRAMEPHFDQIYSIELSHELYEKAKQRFAGCKKIQIIQGDSGIELGKLLPKIHHPTLFWLDGHYSAGVTARADKDTPIFEELSHIYNSSIKKYVIIIDDARCFGVDHDYPTLEELFEFVHSKCPFQVKIEVVNDSIRITP